MNAIVWSSFSLLIVMPLWFLLDVISFFVSKLIANHSDPQVWTVLTNLTDSGNFSDMAIRKQGGN